MQDENTLREVAKDCVHCGFCLPTCPSYLLTGQEMDSPRGRIYMMKAGVEGRPGMTVMNDGIVGHFDTCLGCMACETACPSGVRYAPLIEETRAAIEHLDFRSAAGINRTELEARGYVGLPGQSILVLRAQRQDSDVPLPPYLKALLGGMSNLRGFKAGTAVGDTLVAGSVELRTPLTSPLKIAKFGINAFVDVGTVYDTGERLGDQTFQQGVGAGVWFSAAFFRTNLVVAHGIGAGTRVHFGTTLSF